MMTLLLREVGVLVVMLYSTDELITKIKCYFLDIITMIKHYFLDV